MNEIFRSTLRRNGTLAALLAAFAFPSATVVAQTGTQISPVSEASLTLPDEPSLLRSSSSAEAAPAPPATGSTLPEASKTESTIEPGQAAPQLAAKDKALIGVKDSFSLMGAAGWLASAGYEQLVNGSPNYGTNSRAFGQRLGAAALRDTSETLISESIMAPLLREDPRYYRMGPGRNFLVRLIYAGTRPIITRTDSGKLSPNLAQLAGNLAGSALTNAYYPHLNRGATQTMETFGGSLGGSAVGDVVTEFFGDVVNLFHPSRR